MPCRGRNIWNPFMISTFFNKGLQLKITSFPQNKNTLMHDVYHYDLCCCNDDYMVGVFCFSSCSGHLSQVVLNGLITAASPFANKPFNLSDFPIEHFQASGPFQTGCCDFPCTPRADRQIVPISAPVARPPKQTAGSGFLSCFSPACTYK